MKEGKKYHFKAWEDDVIWNATREGEPSDRIAMRLGVNTKSVNDRYEGLMEMVEVLQVPYDKLPIYGQRHKFAPHTWTEEDYVYLGKHSDDIKGLCKHFKLPRASILREMNTLKNKMNRDAAYQGERARRELKKEDPPVRKRTSLELLVEIDNKLSDVVRYVRTLTEIERERLDIEKEEKRRSQPEPTPTVSTIPASPVTTDMAPSGGQVTLLEG